MTLHTLLQFFGWMLMVNRDEKTAASRGTNALDIGTLRLSGGFLMAHGVDLPNHFPDRMWVLEGVAA